MDKGRCAQYQYPIEHAKACGGLAAGGFRLSGEDDGRRTTERSQRARQHLSWPLQRAVEGPSHRSTDLGLWWG